MHTPPLTVSRRSTSSGTLRGLSQTARALEWEKITGAADTSSAACMVAADTCDRSTSMPSRFISSTTERPKSAQPTLELWVSVMYRTPSENSIRSTPSDPAIEWPPSAPSSDAILPARNASSTSSAVSAS